MPSLQRPDAQRAMTKLNQETLFKTEVFAMSQQVMNVHQAKTHLSRLLERAHAGEEIILAKADKPYAPLMPLAAAPVQRQPGRLQGRLDDDFFEALPEVELDAWRGSSKSR